MPGSKIEKYGKLLGEWKIKKVLYENKNGTMVLQIYKLGTDWEENCALKVVPIIDDYGEWNQLPEEIKESYLEAKIESRKNAEKEVRLMYTLRGCSNIVSYYDFFFDDWAVDNRFGCDLLIRMELLECLRTYMHTKRYTEKEIIKVGIDICKALVNCHNKDIVHRDIKPENIFINASGDYLLGDFGISRIVNNAKRASTSTGTVEYMAPEQVRGNNLGNYGLTVDIYSLGLTLYELANGGKLPFAKSIRITQAENALRLSGKKMPVPNGVGEELADIILKACEYDASKRYQSADELLREFTWLDRRNSEKEDDEKIEQVTLNEKEVSLVMQEDEYATALADAVILPQLRGTCEEKVEVASEVNLKEDKDSSDEFEFIFNELEFSNSDAVKEDVCSSQEYTIIDLNESQIVSDGAQKANGGLRDANRNTRYNLYKILGLREESDETISRMLLHWKYVAQYEQNLESQLRLACIYYEGRVVKRDIEEALKWCYAAAKQNNPKVQFCVGCLLDEEYGEQRSEEVLEWYLKAANQNHVDAQLALGRCYYDGKGAKKDYNEAIGWFKKAADQNNSEGQCWVGLCYHRMHDEEKAVRWYTMAAEQDELLAQYFLGECYYTGKGIKRNYQMAVKWLKKAAEQGMASVMLGDCYYFKKKGVRQDYNEAYKWYRKASESNDKWAQIRLGDCYYYGNGVKKDYRKALEKYKEAVYWYDTEAAALWRLGNCYFHGEGVNQDYSKAIDYFSKALKREKYTSYEKSNDKFQIEGRLCLGECYHYGNGTEQDYESAWQYFLMAANEGNKEAQFFLGEYNYYGYIKRKVFSEAVKWYQRAADQGHVKAYYMLGYCYYIGGEGVKCNFKKAVACYEEAVKRGYVPTDNIPDYYKAAKFRSFFSWK